MAFYKIQVSVQIALYNAVVLTWKEKVKDSVGHESITGMPLRREGDPSRQVEVGTTGHTHLTGRNRVRSKYCSSNRGPAALCANVMAPGSRRQAPGVVCSVSESGVFPLTRCERE